MASFFVDANTIISALLFAGNESRLLEHARLGLCELATNEHVREEVRRFLERQPELGAVRRGHAMSQLARRIVVLPDPPRDDLAAARLLVPDPRDLAVAVGFIALAGVAAETGVVMLIYLDQAFAAITDKRRAAQQRVTVADLYEAVMQGAAMRVRPLMMTVFAIIAGLLPIMWGTGAGSEVMRRIAAPMVGGMVSATILTLMVIPAIYAMVKGWSLEHGVRDAASGGA